MTIMVWILPTVALFLRTYQFEIGDWRF